MIVGGSSGLGLELAKVYGKNGFQIILVGRSGNKLEQAVNMLNLLEVSAVRIYSSDVTSLENVKSLADRIIADHGTIDRLINCAGIGHFGPIEELTDGQVNEMMSVNFFGTFYMTQVFKPFINERVINIISTAGLRGKKNESAYCASKFAVRGLTESLQVEWKDDKVDVTGVYMGGMNTPFWDHNNFVADKSRLKDPSDVAKTIFEQEDGRASIVIEK